MAKVLQHRRGTATEHSNFVGAEGEFTYDTSEKRVRVHDGSTKGGVPLAKVSEVNQVQTNLDSAKTELQNKVNQVAASAGDAFQEDILEAARAAAGAEVSASGVDQLQAALASLESVVGNIQNAFNSLQQNQKAYIIAEWRSGRNWYRKWSSGFIEQGGMVYDVHWGTTSYFHTPFTTTDITLIGQSDGNIGADWNYVNGIGVRVDSPSQFTLSSGHNGRFNIHWVAYGY